MSRQVGDERGRYSRKSLRDRAIEAVDWARAHPAASSVLALFLGVVAIGYLAPARSAMPDDLRVGDCLYIRTTSSMAVGDDARPIGPTSEVEAVLMSGGAEQAGCDTSHGHEVALVVDLQPSAGASLEGERAALQTTCDRTFESFVGRPAALSLYETFVAIPNPDARAAGVTHAACLVARRDGHWMTSPARGSGE